MNYLYHSHIGDAYISDKILPEEELRCQLCGKSDVLLGNFNSPHELQELVNNNNIYYSEYLNVELSAIASNYNLKCENESGIIRLIQ